MAGFGSLWARSGSSLWEISPGGRVVDRIANVFTTKRAAVGPQNLAIGFGSVWTVAPRSVLRIDPSTGHVAAHIAVPRGCDQITAGSDAMFLGCRDSRLVRIDPDTNKASVIVTVGVSPVGIAFGQGSIWWINASEAGDVSKIDPSNGSVVSISAPYAKFVVPTRSHVWFIDANGRVFTVDESGKGSTPAIKRARAALGVTSSKGTVFINDGDLVSFDADTGTVMQRTRVAGRQNWQAIAGIATLGPNLWLVDPKGQRIVAVPR
jgi:hypothetical protein